MRFYRRIWINERGFPTDLYQKIVTLKPQCREGDHFRLECQPGDEDCGQVVAKIVEMCELRGLERSAGTTGSYGYEVDRIYDSADLQEVELLLLEATRPFLHDISRDSSGRLVLPAGRAKAVRTVASVYPTHWIIISDHVREILKAGVFVGLRFGDVVVGALRVQTPSRFWELKADVRLPRMLNSIYFEERPLPSYGIVDGPYRRGEIHYRRSDLQELGAFDIANTFEPLGHPHPALVISQRFYQHCLNHHLHLEVRPVRIEP